MAASKLPRSNFSSNKSDHHDFTIGTGPDSQPTKTSEHGAPIQSGRGIESVREQIEKAFAPIRTVERRRYAKPGELNPGLVGRRKNDPPRAQLAQLAQPILRQMNATAMSGVQNRKDGR